MSDFGPYLDALAKKDAEIARLRDEVGTIRRSAIAAGIVPASESEDHDYLICKSFGDGKLAEREVKHLRDCHKTQVDRAEQAERERDKAMVRGDHCRRCGVRLQTAITGRHGELCEDCHYAEIGEEIDKHPIGVPTRRRAMGELKQKYASVDIPSEAGVAELRAEIARQKEALNGYARRTMAAERGRDEALAREAVLAGALEKIRDCAPFHRHHAWMSPEGLHKIAEDALANVSDRAKQMLEAVEALRIIARNTMAGAVNVFWVKDFADKAVRAMEGKEGKGE